MDSRERLRAILELRGWSQRKLSERTGVSNSHISAYLAGTRKDMSFELMAQLAQALNVSLDWLAGLPPRNSEALAPDEAELLAQYRRIASSEIRQFIVNAARDAPKRD